MKFVEYKHLYSQRSSSGQKLSIGLDWPEFYRQSMQLDNQLVRSIAAVEALHYSQGKPYFNVYPCIIEMCNRLPLDTPALALREDTLKGMGVFGSKALSLRLPADGNHDGCLCAFDEATDGYQVVQFLTYVASGDRLGESALKTSFVIREGMTLKDLEPQVMEHGSNVALLQTRLFCCLAMLAERSLGFIERDVCARDRGKPVTDAILRRAEARKGKGWNIGRELESIPHARRPHWAVRWMRPNENEAPVKRGLVPRLRPIKGSIVNAEKLTKVPSGFAGD